MYQDILQFWFEEIDQSKWFAKDEAFDRLIAEQFADIHAQAVSCELFEWRQNAPGRLAEIIVLDQFSRNLFRDSALAFANDKMALALAQEAISRGADKKLNVVERGFLYLPFMHSESAAIHRIAEDIYRRHGVQSSLEWELKHKAIIDRFGRYPHRNEVLGRKSTGEELAFLEQPGSRF